MSSDADGASPSPVMSPATPPEIRSVHHQRYLERKKEEERQAELERQLAADEEYARSLLQEETPDDGPPAPSAEEGVRPADAAYVQRLSDFYDEPEYGDVEQAGGADVYRQLQDEDGMEVEQPMQFRPARGNARARRRLSRIGVRAATFCLFLMFGYILSGILSHPSADVVDVRPGDGGRPVVPLRPLPVVTAAPRDAADAHDAAPTTARAEEASSVPAAGATTQVPV